MPWKLYNFYLCFAITYHCTYTNKYKSNEQCNVPMAHTPMNSFTFCGLMPWRIHYTVVFFIFWNNHKMATLLILMDDLSNKVCYVLKNYMYSDKWYEIEQICKNWKQMQKPLQIPSLEIRLRPMYLASIKITCTWRRRHGGSSY